MYVPIGLGRIFKTRFLSVHAGLLRWVLPDVVNVRKLSSSKVTRCQIDSFNQSNHRVLLSSAFCCLVHSAATTVAYVAYQRLIRIRS